MTKTPLQLELSRPLIVDRVSRKGSHEHIVAEANECSALAKRFAIPVVHTLDARFLATAQKLADYFLANLPPDYVPYWDFSRISPAPRDSSAAAIAAAGLLELSKYTIDSVTKSNYYNGALQIQTSLSNPTLYLANPTPATPQLPLAAL